MGRTNISLVSLVVHSKVFVLSKSQNCKRDEQLVPSGIILAGGNSNAQDLGQNKWCSFLSFLICTFWEETVVGFLVSSCPP